MSREAFIRALTREVDEALEAQRRADLAWLQSFGVPPLTRAQRWRARLGRIRCALARPLQWLADKVRGYELGGYD